MNKRLVHEIIDSFADDVDIAELSHKLHVMQEIQLGEKEIDEGRFLTQEEAKKRFARWLAGDQCPGRDS